MQSRLSKASKDDIETIAGLLKDMSLELQEFDCIEDIFRKSVAASFAEGIHWFLFIDEDSRPFGTCYLQSVHNYWRLEKRFYLGGFYIAPSHRKQGRFKEINIRLKEWAESQGGVQIYAHIHKDNEKSLKAFESVGILPDDYCLCIYHWGE